MNLLILLLIFSDYISAFEQLVLLQCTSVVYPDCANQLQIVAQSQLDYRWQYHQIVLVTHIYCASIITTTGALLLWLLWLMKQLPRATLFDSNTSLLLYNSTHQLIVFNISNNNTLSTPSPVHLQSSTLLVVLHHQQQHYYSNTLLLLLLQLTSSSLQFGHLQWSLPASFIPPSPILRHWNPPGQV